jgi:hypothetical protein
MDPTDPDQQYWFSFFSYIFFDTRLDTSTAAEVSSGEKMEEDDTKNENLVSENQLPAVLPTENNNYNGSHLALKRSFVGSEKSAGEPPSKRIMKEMSAVDLRDQIQA